MTHFFSTTASKISLAIAFTALTLVLSTSAYGDEYDRIDRWAQKIQKKSRLLVKETVHYRHTPQYRSLVDATTHLYDAATHVHEVAHFANNLDHLQADLADLDLYFHQLESLFQATEDSASRGHGHVRKTGYAKGLLRSIEVSIDQMRREVRKLQSKTIKHHKVHRAPVPTVRHGNHDLHGRGPKAVQPRVVPASYRPPSFQPACPQLRSNGINLSIGGGRFNIGF